MINFRYHIISLAAVFLALGLGLTLGSTFLDRTFVSALESQLDTLEGRLSDKRTELGEADAELDRATVADDAMLEGGLAGLAAKPLDGTTVVPVVAEGVPAEIVERFVGLAAAAGADIPATLWLQEKLNIDDAGQVEDLADTLGLSQDVEPQERGRLVVDLVANALLTTSESPEPSGESDSPTSGNSPAGETGVSGVSGASSASGASGASGPTGIAGSPFPTGSSGDEANTDPDLADLIDAEFIAATDDGVPVSVVDPFPAGTNVVLITGVGAAVPAEAFAAPLASALAEDGSRRLVVATCIQPGTRKDASREASVDARNAQIGPFRSQPAIADNASTIDDLERPIGALATIYAIADLQDGQFGAFGVAEGAGALLPDLNG